MKNIYKVAFCGKMGSGKTTASLSILGLLHEKYGADDAIGFVIKFANPLYAAVNAFHQQTKPRVFMQRLGDLARREFGDDIMERIFEQNVEGLINIKIPEMPQSHILIMTDDLRFMGEYKLVKQLGFSVVKMECDEEVRRNRIGASFTNTKHRSEIELDLIQPDYTLLNNGIDPLCLDLDANLRNLVEQHKILGE
jgi:hypothetical protein